MNEDEICRALNESLDALGKIDDPDDEIVALAELTQAKIESLIIQERCRNFLRMWRKRPSPSRVSQ